MKIIAHLMPDLPYATKEDDTEMFNQILNNSNLLCDEYKIYPCVATDYTIIKKWADKGSYIHNVDKDPNYLQDVIGEYMSKVQPWVRIPRIIRDIPNDYIHYGNKEGHLREKIDNKVVTNEIRGREIKNTILPKYPVLLVDKYLSSGVYEYFIRYETDNNSDGNSKILGFCRLRLNGNTNNTFFPELFNCAIIRELHVYGKTTIVNSKIKTGTQHQVQHLGLGKKLVKHAEWIAFKNGYHSVCITSGIGVREYYRKKLGYKLEGLFMKKNIWVKYIIYILMCITLIMAHLISLIYVSLIW